MVDQPDQDLATLKIVLQIKSMSGVINIIDIKFCVNNLLIDWTKMVQTITYH
jgi:hypothetical protein